MVDNRLSPLFGANVDPSTRDPKEPWRRARVADEQGLDLITIQDHPYNADFFETWTLMVALGMATHRVHVGANVLCTPLRPPAMLAKMAASLDVMTQGRAELGLGAGAVPQGIHAFGGPEYSPGESYQGFKETLEIIRGLWEHAGDSFSYDGEFHHVHGAQFGPAPAHSIRIWAGALGPRMQRLTGQLADGLLISNSYVPEDRLPEVNRLLDEGAAEAGRPPTAVRRGYNLMGVLELSGGARVRARQGMLVGSVARWTEEIVRLYHEQRQDTFIFWPVAGDELAQIEVFAGEVAPAVRAGLGQSA